MISNSKPMTNRKKRKQKQRKTKNKYPKIKGRKFRLRYSRIEKVMMTRE